jgi:hypothetical protein
MILVRPSSAQKGAAFPIIREHKNDRARELCNAILEYAVKQDEYLQQIYEKDRIDDKTVVIIKPG